MPQGGRKVPFSGKAKKQQMQAKKQRKNHILVGNRSKDNSDDELNNHHQDDTKINQQPQNGRNRYALKFFHESQDELRKRKEEAKNAIETLLEKMQEVSDNYYPPGIDMPKRPSWNFSMSKQQVEHREQKYFTDYLKGIEKLNDVSYFELNLETWRQLWRVLEMSDMLLIIVDIRYPVAMFPPYLYHYVTNELHKDMILVLNKIDLAPPSLVVAWKDYFSTLYPEIHILMFTSYPVYNLRGNTMEKEGIQKRHRKAKLKMAAEGAQKLLDVCKNIVGDKVDLSSWHNKIQEEMNMEDDVDDLEREDNVITEEQDTTYFRHERYKNSTLTIGCIGTPNVGKSSVINALMGKKVVSVSRSPGHTKHFQTIFLTKTVCLCDCPGLVFPSTVPKQLQILMGSFPIAQVREPYTSIRFLAERIDLIKFLRLQHPDNEDTWSAIDICDSWAMKRNFITARTARLDTYRAANSLLRMGLEGKITIFLYPPGWFSNKEKWEKHPDVDMVRWIQAREQDHTISEIISMSSEDEEESESVETEENLKSKESSTSDDTSSEMYMPPIVNKFDVLSTEM